MLLREAAETQASNATLLAVPFSAFLLYSAVWLTLGGGLAFVAAFAFFQSSLGICLLLQPSPEDNFGA